MENNRLTPFQMIFFAVLILVIIIAVIMFAFQRQKASQTAAAITMWGIVPKDDFQAIQRLINNNDDKSRHINVIYQEKDMEQFDAEFLEALATGQGPDAVLIPFDFLLKHENKFLTLDYKFYSLKDYKNDFIDGSFKLLNQNGILGFPISADPLLLYWNRTILNSNGISLPPTTWDDFVKFVPQLVRKDDNFNINRAAGALGESQNITNFKEIILALLMQSNNDVVVRTVSDEEEKYENIFDNRLGFSIAPANATLNFFTQFSNPASSLYTWNKSLPNDLEMFLSNDLAFYFGFASDYESIRLKNPNLNFAIASLPQREEENKKTFANMYFFAVVKNSTNINNALQNIYNLIAKDNAKIFNEYLGLSPARRDLLLIKEGNDEVQQTINDSALFASPFLDPNPDQTKQILGEMIDLYSSGRKDLSTVINEAHRKINSLIQ